MLCACAEYHRSQRIPVEVNFQSPKRRDGEILERLNERSWLEFEFIAFIQVSGGGADPYPLLLRIPRTIACT